MILNAKDKIIKAKIQIGHFKDGQPFFSHLLSFLQLTEDKNIPTMGVSNSNKLYYNPEFVEKLDLETLKGVLIHETLHVALGHLFRIGNRKHLLWNIAGDIMINNMLVNNGFSLPSEGIIPENNEYTLPGTNKTLKAIDKKSSEEIYSWLEDEAPESKTHNPFEQDSGSSQPAPPNSVPSFDEHKYEDGESNKGENQKTADEKAMKEWNDKIIEANTIAQMKGKSPLGMGRVIDSVMNNQINWRQLLNKYITNNIISDYTWRRPSRRSISTGLYLPSTLKENVEIIISIDTSGSIGQEELTSFVSEIVHIVKSTNNLTATVIDCDTEVYNELTVRNGNVKKILEMKINGGGGTSHRAIYDYVNDKHPTQKLLINFTDGYTDFPDKKQDFETVWVITKDGCEEDHIPFGKVIKMR